MNTFFNINIYIIILFLSFSGCKKIKINYSNELIKKNIELKNNLFKLNIDGIECESCAKSVIEIIKKNKNVLKTELVCEKNFDKCYAKIFTKDKNIHFELIRKELKSDGFILKSVVGKFSGYYFLKDNHVYFKFDNLDIYAKVKYKINKVINYDEPTFVEGKLDMCNNFVLYI